MHQSSYLSIYLSFYLSISLSLSLSLSLSVYLSVYLPIPMCAHTRGRFHTTLGKLLNPLTLNPLKALKKPYNWHSFRPHILGFRVSGLGFRVCAKPRPLKQYPRSGLWSLLNRPVRGPFARPLTP